MDNGTIHWCLYGHRAGQPSPRSKFRIFSKPGILSPSSPNMYTIWRCAIQWHNNSQRCATITSIWFWNISITPKGNPIPMSNHFPFLPPQLATAILFCVSLDLPVLDILYKWIISTMWAFVTVSSIWHNVSSSSLMASLLFCKHANLLPAVRAFALAASHSWDALPLPTPLPSAHLFLRTLCVLAELSPLEEMPYLTALSGSLWLLLLMTPCCPHYNM